MKKFLLSLAAVACACAINAQNGAPLYCTGDFAASNWTPEAPVEFAWDGTNYTYSFDEVSSFKLSTVMGGWDDFNAACIHVEGFPEEPGTFDLVPGDGNTQMPWKGQWDAVVSADLSTITLTTTTPNPNEGKLPEIYLRGDMNSWGVDAAWQMTTTDGKIYRYTTADDNLIQPGVAFKFADADWGKYNFSTGSEIMPFADEAEAMENLYGPLAYNIMSNITIAYDAEPTVVSFILDVTDLTNVTLACFCGESGVEALSIDGANVAPVYYNLMGVRVSNPENGVFVKVCGDKVSKVLVK